MRLLHDPRSFSALAFGLLLCVPFAATHAATAPASTMSGQQNPDQRLLVRHPTSVSLPQSTAFAILGHSCGGIGEHAYMTGFDPVSGYPTGAVRLTTTCSLGGIGGNTITYTAWAGVTWDFGGGVLSAAALASAPPVDPTFSAFDAYGDEVFNAGNAAYLLVPLPGVPNAVSALQSGDQFQVSWTPRGVTPAAITSTTLTATPVNSSAPVLTATIAGSATSGIIPMLQPQTTYAIRVVNTTLSGSGSPSVPLEVTTSNATIPPGAPTALAATWSNPNPSGSTDTLVATWHAADPGNSPIDQYMITITDSETSNTYTQSVSGTTLGASFTVDWVPDWGVQVKAHNAFGWGPWSNVYMLGGL